MMDIPFSINIIKNKNISEMTDNFCQVVVAKKVCKCIKFSKNIRKNKNVLFFSAVYFVYAAQELIEMSILAFGEKHCIESDGQLTLR
jgi:hypothetical protein